MRRGQQPELRLLTQSWVESWLQCLASGFSSQMPLGLLWETSCFHLSEDPRINDTWPLPGPLVLFPDTGWDKKHMAARRQARETVASLLSDLEMADLTEAMPHWMLKDEQNFQGVGGN